MKKWRRLSWAETRRIYVFVLKLGYNVCIIKRKEGDIIVMTNPNNAKAMVYIKLKD